MKNGQRVSLVRMLAFLVGLATTLLSVEAAEHRLEEFSIVVADEYSEVVRREQNERGEKVTFYAFVAPARKDGTQTHLQVTVMQSDKVTNAVRKDSPVLPDAVRGLTDKLLLEWVSGIEQRRQKFKRTKPADFESGKRVYRKLEWSGTVQGRAMLGRAYAILNGERFYFFAIQDFTEYADASFKRLEPALEHFKPSSSP